MLSKTLIEFGLTEKASKVYLALLEHEIATVNQIAKVTGINRSSTYVVLESLQKKGLVGITDDKRVQQYMAISPDALMRIAEDSAKKHEIIKNKIDKLVPELKALYKGTKRKPLVKVYEGKQGLINAFEDTLKMKEKVIRISSSVGNLFNVFSDYFPEYVEMRRKKGIVMHGIHPNDLPAQMLITNAPDRFDKPILIPSKKYSFPADLAIYDNKISYMSLDGKGIAIVIESKEMADVMKSVFDLAFTEAKRLAKKAK